MNKNDQDMIRKIKEKSEQVPVPKALEPRQIEAKLAGKKKKVWTPARIGGLAAACLVLIVGVMVCQNYFKMEDATRDDKIAGSDVTISDSTKVESAAEYKDVYAYLEKYKKDQERDSAYTSSWARSLNDIRVDESADSKASGDAAQNMEESSTAAADTGMASGSYSETNVRQEGVDEGDTAKTDGTYLYVLKDKSDQIAIIDTRDNRMKQTATITVEDVSEIQEMYLDIERNQLIAVCDGYVGGKWNDDDYGYGQRANTTAVTYDISDRENPKEVGRVSQSGYYNSSRIADGYLYLFSDYYVTLDGITAKNPKSYIPLVNDNLIKETDICLPSISKADMYSIITSVSLENPNETAHSKALLADGGNLYVSNDNIYFYENVWQYSGKDVTTIRKVSYESGKLTAGAQCKIDGYINDSFSIDEYDGYLQLENGVGMLRLLETEVKETLEGLSGDDRKVTGRIATGKLAAPFIARYIKEIQKKYPNVQIPVTTIENRFFGEKITVSGLITGQDLKEQLSGLDLGEKLLIPCSMLKGDEEIFLDDMTLEELSEALNTEIVIVDTGGRDLVEAVIYPPEHKQTRRRQIYEQTSSSDSGKA